MTEAGLSYTWHGVLRGMRAVAPLSLGGIPFALVCGAVAQAHGLSFLANLFFICVVYSGSMQLVVLASWALPVPIIPSLIAGCVVALRLALWAPVMAPWLARLSAGRRLLNLALLGDMNWSMNFAEMRRGGSDAGYMLGTGLMLWANWAVFGVLGYLGAASFSFPAGHPVFFAGTAAFLANLLHIARRWVDALPVAVAAGVALLVSRLLPGSAWYIVAGALAGAGAGLARDRLAGSTP